MGRTEKKKNHVTCMACISLQAHHIPGLHTLRTHCPLHCHTRWMVAPPRCTHTVRVTYRICQYHRVASRFTTLPHYPIIRWNVCPTRRLPHAGPIPLPGSPHCCYLVVGLRLLLPARLPLPFPALCYPAPTLCMLHTLLPTRILPAAL